MFIGVVMISFEGVEVVVDVRFGSELFFVIRGSSFM